MSNLNSSVVTVSPGSLSALFSGIDLNKKNTSAKSFAELIRILIQEYSYCCTIQETMDLVNTLKNCHSGEHYNFIQHMSMFIPVPILIKLSDNYFELLKRIKDEILLSKFNMIATKESLEDEIRMMKAHELYLNHIIKHDKRNIAMIMDGNRAVLTLPTIYDWYENTRMEITLILTVCVMLRSGYIKNISDAFSEDDFIEGDNAEKDARSKKIMDFITENPKYDAEEQWKSVCDTFKAMIGEDEMKKINDDMMSFVKHTKFIF